MCGIAGAVDASGRALDDDVLAAMCGAMARRGPDDEGRWRNGVVMLGHRRLSIIDLGGGHQPMASVDGKYEIVFNGEIYNYRELRSLLEARGATFRTASDTEVVLEAYRAFGDDFVGHLDGMFALALWDAATRRLVLARDRFGKKPLYFFVQGGALVFASTLTSLLAHPHAPRTIDRAALAEYLALEYVVAPRTILSDIEKLEPATVLVFDGTRGEVIRRERYWRLPAPGTLALDAHEAAGELERRLRAAVRKRLVADVPLGVFLSGGVDSSTVTALAAAESSRPVRTFSIKFAEPSFDESAHARRAAAHLGTDHAEEELSLAEAARIVESLGDILDEPVADGSVVPTYLLSRFARRHVTVALGGDGGDELFAGYPTYLAHRLATLAGPLAHPRLVGLARALAAKLPVSHDNFSFDFKLKKMLAGLDARADERNYVWLGAHEPARIARLLGDEFDVYAAPRARYADTGGGTHLERVLYQDVGLYMTHSVLAKVDRASMAASLEVRAPLLDTAVAELAASLPLGLKLRGLTGKYLLKQVARRHLPPSIVDRKKKGFGMPTGKWLREDLAPLARELLFDGNSLAASGLLQRSEVQSLWDEHQRGAVDHRQRLWSLVVLELWRRAHRV